MTVRLSVARRRRLETRAVFVRTESLLVLKISTGYLPRAAGRRKSARNTTPSRMGTATFFSTKAYDSPLYARTPKAMSDADVIDAMNLLLGGNDSDMVRSLRAV